MLVMNALIDVLQIVSGVAPWELGIDKLKENKLSSSYRSKTIWLKKLKYVVRILDEINVNYVLIKYLDIPFAYMQDIDLLIESPSDRRKLFEKLLNLGFIPFQSIFPPHKDKLEFRLMEKNIDVDIYPNPSWWKIRFAPDFLITATRKKTRLGSLEVYVPDPTYDLLITVTHSYAHSTITLGELAHEVKLLMFNSIHWSTFTALTEIYHLEQAALSHLMLLKQLLRIAKKYNTSSRSCFLYENFEKMTNVVNLLLSKSALNRKIASIVLSKAFNSSFPITLPINTRAFSALHEVYLGMLKKHRFQSNELQTYIMLLMGAGRMRKRLRKYT